MDIFVPVLFNGISYGMVLFLIAAGMSLVMGIMGITNMAHGAIYMIGAYVGWMLAVQLKVNFWLAAIIGGIIGGLVGMAIERFFLRKLYKQPNEQLLLTFGFVYIITNICLWIWGGRPRLQFTDPALNTSVEIGGINFAMVRIVIVIVGGILAFLLWWMQDKTKIGAMVKAGMDDKEMTMGLGINLMFVQALVFFIASFVAGFAGTIGAQLLGVSNTMGSEMFLMALIVIIIGGVGSVQGALLGSIIIGLIDAFGKALFPEIAMFSMYIAMIAILLLRPKGLLGREI